MARDDFDGAEVDRLLNDLESRRRAPAAAAAAPPSTPAGTSTAPGQTDGRVRTPGRRWSTARFLMPAVTPKEPRRALAFVSTMHLPALPQFSLPTLTDRQWAVFTAWLFVGLGGVLSAAMPFWPYAKGCSLGLGLNLSAELLVVVTGVWGAKLTWEARMGAAHALALCVMFWGLTLVTAEVLPRVGYAQVQQAWFCSY